MKHKDFKLLIKKKFSKITDFFVGNNVEFKKITKHFFGTEEHKIIDEQIKSNKQTFKLFLIIFLIIMCALIIKGTISTSLFLFNDDGTINEIERKDVDSDERIDLTVCTDEESKDVSINFYANDKEGENAKDKEKSFDQQVKEIIADIENNNDEKISLPKKLPNNQEIRWLEQSDRSIYIVLALGLVLLFVIYKNKDSKINSAKKKAINQVTKELPRLINKIILIWKSGKTFEDAVKESVEKLEKGDIEDYFVTNLKEIYEKNQDSGENIVYLINNFASNTNIKDFCRITNIMLENQYKGSFLLEKLEMEREILWISRKKAALEQGKKAETKLVIPMAILLIALIIVTAAPAFIQM